MYLTFKGAKNVETSAFTPHEDRKVLTYEEERMIAIEKKKSA